EKAETKPAKKNKFDTFFEHRAVQVAFGLLALVCAYAFASWAIDRGSLLDYAIALLWLVVGARELAAAARKRR
ncbi:MAG TPA: hypothetical protein VJ836_06865, partial [Candidatus Saccharimonadales bacterium]|nr:hypothetical protein [Candidatus Saccharimonadales bacterium]